MPSHRTLKFKVIVWSNWSAAEGSAAGTLDASTTFEQTGHEGVGDDAVHPQGGHIDLGRLLDAPDDFTHHVKIDIHLESHMTDERGQPVHARWARVGEGSNPAIAATLLRTDCSRTLNRRRLRSCRPPLVAFN